MDSYIWLGIVERFLTGIRWFFWRYFRLNDSLLPVNVIKISPKLILYVSKLFGPCFLEILIEGFDLRFVFEILKINFVITDDLIEFATNHYFVNILGFVNRNNLSHCIADF